MFNNNTRAENPEAEPVTEDKTSSVMLEEPQAEEVQQQPEDEWKSKYEAMYDQFVRLSADFDNYRKRVREEQEGLVKYGAQKSVMELLPIVDNLDRATASLTENSDPKTLYQSFGVMKKQLLDGFDTLGVKKISAVGQAFDPQFHEAVSQMESAEFPEGTVMFETQSGYMLHDKVLRPALVIVSTGSGDASTDAPAETEASAGTEAPVKNPFMK